MFNQVHTCPLDGGLGGTKTSIMCDQTGAKSNGCATFAGSHTALTLVEAGAKVTIVDNLSNSYTEVLVRMKKLLGDKFSAITFVQVRLGLQKAWLFNFCDASEGDIINCEY